MKYTIDRIQEMFSDLESGVRTRESIAEDALLALDADEKGELTIEPRGDFDRIWKAITYLSGVDIKDSPVSYLHSTDNFVQFRIKMGF